MILGIDIGGTGIKFGMIADDYTIVHSCSIPTLSQRPVDEIVGDIIKKAKELHTAYAFDRIGVDTPGDIDSKNGICNRAGNLPYHKTPLGPMISEALQLPVYIANDATAALFGSKGYGGELGHMIIKHDALPCPCGLTGCYEQYASVTALVRQIKDAIAARPDSLLAKICGDTPSARDVFTTKEQGCPVAAAVLDQYTTYIAIGLNSYEAIFQPEIFIIGGAISQQDENLLEPIRQKLRKPTMLVTSSLKNDAGIIGAAVVAKVFL